MMKLNIKEWFKTSADSGKLVLRSKTSRHGSYSVGYTALVLAVILVLNLIISELPTKFTKIDVSGTGLYTITEQTTAVLEGLSEDVTLYLIAQEGNEDETVAHLLKQYEEECDHIEVVYKDPVKNPTFAEQYTSGDLYDNSVIVVCGEKNKVVSYEDIYNYEYDYYSGSYSTTEFDGEGQITSAISYVTSEDLPVMYVVNGHNEATLSETFEDAVIKENIQIEELNLITADAVPEDTSCLFLFSPTVDYSAEEAEKVISYLENGGDALIISSYSNTEMPNFQSILAAYGLQIGDGIILEGDSGYTMSQNPMYMVPDYVSSEITEQLSENNRYVAYPVAQAVYTLEEYRDTLNIQPLLVTSAQAYEKADPENIDSYAKTSDDAGGPFYLAMAVSEEVNDTMTRLVCYTTEYFLDESMNYYVSGGNLDLFNETICYLVDHEVSSSIEAKSLEISSLTITSGSANIWAILTTVLVPIVLLMTGTVVCWRRRKR